MSTETIRCAKCGRECQPVNDADAPVTRCVDCASLPGAPALAAREETDVLAELIEEVADWIRADLKMGVGAEAIDFSVRAHFRDRLLTALLSDIPEEPISAHEIERLEVMRKAGRAALQTFDAKPAESDRLATPEADALAADELRKLAEEDRDRWRAMYDESASEAGAATLREALQQAEQERDILWVAVDHYAEAVEDDDGATAKDALAQLAALRAALPAATPREGET